MSCGESVWQTDLVWPGTLALRVGGLQHVHRGPPHLGGGRLGSLASHGSLLAGSSAVDDPAGGEDDH